MYSKKITNNALDRAESSLKLRLTRHPLPFVESAVSWLNKLMQEDGNLVRPLTPDERSFIRNERIVCQLDYNYWRSRYVFIKNFAGNTYVRFEPNVAQKMMNDICGEMEEERIAIFIQQLKARQLGVTTDTEMRIAHRVQFYTNVSAVVASSRPEKSEEMSDKMSDCWSRQPWWLMPRQGRSRAGAMIEFVDLNSFVSIQHGAQMTGIARGTTPTIAHLSELCEFENPQELVDASLMRAIHHSPFAFFIMESTALGTRNWWHDTWLISKEGWPTRTADFRPVFLPWFVGTDIYPDDTWLRAHPIPANWEPSAIAIAHRARCEAYVSTNHLLRKYLGNDWHLPARQLWWWEVQRNIAVRKKELAHFYMETPSDDIEAFQSTNVSVFDTDTLEILRDNTRSPLAVFGFVGHADNFPLRSQPSRHEIDADSPPIHIKARMSASQSPIECDLVPLRFQGYPSCSEMGKLFLWEMPEDNEEYGVGLDTSEGIGQDRTVMEVLRKGTYTRNDSFVAEFASPQMNSIDIFPYAFVLGCFFSTNSIDDSGEGMLRRPRMVIECRWNGENVQLELQKRGWGNFHKWTRYHKTKYDLSKERNLGWYSNAWSRPMMMDYFIKAIRDDYLECPSPYFVQELSDLVADEGIQDARAAHGAHDDRCMAGGIVYFSLHILEMDGTMRPMRDRRPAQHQSSRAPVYRHPFAGRDMTELGEADIYAPDSYEDDDA
jgi:hypothetical protein